MQQVHAVYRYEFRTDVDGYRRVHSREVYQVFSRMSDAREKAHQLNLSHWNGYLYNVRSHLLYEEVK